MYSLQLGGQDVYKRQVRHCEPLCAASGARVASLHPRQASALFVPAFAPPMWNLSLIHISFAANQRDEVRDLHAVAGALGAQPGMKQQTFVASGVVTKGNGDCFLSRCV